MIELLAALIAYVVVVYPLIKISQYVRRGDGNGLDIFISLR